MYYFDGDLAEYLLDYWVSEEQIEKAKSRKMEHNRDGYYDIPEYIESKEVDYEVNGKFPARFTGCFEYFEKLPFFETWEEFTISNTFL